MSNAKQISKIASKNAAKGLAAWAATLSGMAALADSQLDDWRGALSHQLDHWRGALRGSLKGNSKSLSKSLSRSAKQVTWGPRRVVTRAMLSMRWFRRGVFFGTIGGSILGLLFAPVPGSQLRTQLFTRIQQLTGQVQSTIANVQAGQTSMTTGTTKTSRPAPAAR